MLDELLGRAELKRRVDELEEERERLQRRLDAESDRRADAVTAKQRSEERANRLEDRIAELEGRVERLGGESGAPTLDFRGTEDLRGDRLDEVLARLRSVQTGPEGALTAVVPDDGAPADVTNLLGDRAGLVDRAAPCVVFADDAELVSVALVPSLAPDAFCAWGDRFRVEESWFQPAGTFGFALVRSDLFAFGLYDDRERTTFEGFESDVMNDHSKGGFSQARFERRRDSQIEEHLDRCRAVLSEYEPRYDRLVLVGERTVLSELRGVADATAAVDASGEPVDALETAFRDFWTTRLYRL